MVGARKHLREHAAPLAYGVLPVICLLAFFLYPVARFLLLSLEGGTFEHYERAILDGLYAGVLLDTFRIAVLVTVVCLILGYPVAFFMASAPQPWMMVSLIFLILPFWTSVLIRTYAWSIILGRNGVVNRFLVSAGLIDQPLALLNNELGVVIGMVHVLLPYMVFPIYSIMRRIDFNLVYASQGLGASGWQTFTRVYFPLSVPGVLAGTTLVFVLALGFFITPAILGGGRVTMIAVLIEQQVREILNWGFAAALSAVLLAAALASYGLLSLVLRDRR